MAVIGSATLNIVPKVQGGLANAISGEISKANLASVGRSAGSSLMGGLTSGFSIGAWSAIAQRAIGVVTSSMDGAISRVDTLANYPKIVSNLVQQAGASEAEAAAQAQRSIDVLSTSLDNVPTKLDDMATVVQGMYAASMKYGVGLDTVTDAGLALNSMLLAGGQSTAVVNSAMEQFRQMVAKGKPDLQDWRALISAAPGQMNQLAQSMLGATATADDLYAALGGGKEGDYGGPFEWGSLSMGEFIERFAQMRSDFEGLAEDAQGGIGTAFSNMGNAVTKGVARAVEALGREDLVAAIGDVKSAINELFGKVDEGGLVDFVDRAAPAIWGLWDALKGAAGAVTPELGAIGSFLGDGLLAGLGLASEAVDTFSTGWASLRDLLSDGATGADLFADSVQALSGQAEAVRGAYDVLGGSIDDALGRARDAAKDAKEAHKEYLDVVASGARDVAEANRAYQTQAADLTRAGDVIDAYAGRTDLTMSQQRDLAAAVAEVNDACGTQWGVMEDGYTVYDTETGKVQDNTNAIWDNIEAKNTLARAEGLGTTRNAVDADRAAAANEYQEQAKAAQAADEAMDNLVKKYGSMAEARQKASEVDLLGNPTAEAMQLQKSISVWDQAVTATREADEAQRQFAQTSRELAAEQEALAAKASGAEMSVAQMALSSDVAMQAFNDGGAKAELSITDFADALQECSGNYEVLADLLADPAATAEMVAAYDGTAASLGEFFTDARGGWDSVRAAELDAQGTIDGMAGYILGLSNDAYGAFADMGLSATDAAAKLAAAGVGMQDVEAIGSESFERLAASCGGSLETLTWMVQNYNDVPIADKDGNVVINDSLLVDAQGRLVEWNGTELVYQGTEVAVEDQQLVDAQGRAYEWNGTTLKPLSTYVTADTSGLSSAQAELEWFRSRYDGAVLARASVVVDTSSHVSGSGGNYTFATGGHIVPRHAAGYYATGPTLTNFGWVGEDGIEYVRNNPDGSSDVYPISNRRYSDPLADSIAERLAERGGGDTYNYVINGLSVAPGSALARAMNATFEEAGRLAEMGSRR